MGEVSRRPVARYAGRDCVRDDATGTHGRKPRKVFDWQWLDVVNIVECSRVFRRGLR